MYDFLSGDTPLRKGYLPIVHHLGIKITDSDVLSAVLSGTARYLEN